MNTKTLLNHKRPPVFCPGCSHEKIVKGLDKTLVNMGLLGNQVAIVSDIGCSGLFDTFFNTHAMHGLHGRALTYATGIKLARPDLNVIVTMGDGGLGIGGAHLLSACRRNLDLTLIVLNNFNFGMTGGQFSATTPSHALVGSGFLNNLEKPFDLCSVAAAAGAPYLARCSAYAKDLTEIIENAINFRGFAIIDIWGICTGRYTKKNRITPKLIDEILEKLPPFDGPVKENLRDEYGDLYRKAAKSQKEILPGPAIKPEFTPPESDDPTGIIIMGSAGQRIITAGELVCLAGMSGGLKATQKNEYNITVLRGPSISELILSGKSIGFTGIKKPKVVIALAKEGVERRKATFSELDEVSFVIKAKDVDIPETKAKIYEVDFKALKIKPADRALAGLGILGKLGIAISFDMVKAAVKQKFPEKIQKAAFEVLEKTDKI